MAGEERTAWLRFNCRSVLHALFSQITHLVEHDGPPHATSAGSPR